MGICHTDFSFDLGKPCVAIQGQFYFREKFGELKMNKRLLATITAIVAFLAVAFVTTSHPNSSAKKADTVPTIGILQLVTHP